MFHRAIDIASHHLMFVSLCLLSGTLAAATETAEQPNIILLVADDLGYGELGS